jgi:carbamoyl-phosphate synthase small subunit
VTIGEHSPAYVLLEDGARFDGLACGAAGVAVGEIVFTTSMSGYQESMTDPSYAGQLITFTFPMIGNYGVSPDAMESDRIHARGAIMRAAVDHDGDGWLSWLTDNAIPAITDVDTRALVRHIRDQGAMRGGLFPGELGETEAQERLRAEPEMSGRDLAREVTPAQCVRVGDGDGPRIAMIDTGVKRSIVRNLVERGATVELHPCNTSAGELLGGAPDAVFLANGPGDPAALDYIVGTVRELVGKVPVYGICLGHQLLCRAVGLETYKLPFGHRGANHPVKDLVTGRIEITSQNHGFAVSAPDGSPTIDADEAVRWETDFGTAELTHINLYDRTVEGLALRDVKGATVQYHPEAGPGPHDAVHLFDRFIGEIGGARGARPRGDVGRKSRIGGLSSQTSSALESDTSSTRDTQENGASNRGGAPEAD